MIFGFIANSQNSFNILTVQETIFFLINQETIFVLAVCAYMTQIFAYEIIYLIMIN